MKRRKWKQALLPLSLLLCVLAVIASLCIGAIWFSPLQLVHLIRGAEADASVYNIFWYSRLPRTVAALLAGAALSVSGAVLQNVLANKLASPSIIGVNAGAGLGVTLACAAGMLSGWGISCAAFLGSLCTVLVISLFASHTGASRTTVILTGVALNSILSAATESVTVLIPEVAALNTEFRMGGFSAVTYPRLIPAAVLILTALAILLTLCNELDVVTLGDDVARGLGLRVGRWRILFLVLAALLAGSAVSFSGLLGFVGLMVPHFVRWISGGESRRMLPLCAILGGAFVVLCDLIARQLFSPFELPVGILMAVLGGPVFVLLLVRLKGGHHHD